MRHLYSIITLSILIVGCSNSKKQTQKDTIITSDTIPNTNEKTKIKPKIKKAESTQLTDSIVDLYSGFWVNNEFLKQVEAKKSIYKSKGYEGELFGFTLDREGLSKGKTGINGFTVHEGGYGVPIKWIDKFACFTSTGQIEEYSSIQTPMDVVIVEKDLIEFQFEDSHSEYYRKVVDDYSELRKILFKGNYLDSLETIYQFDSDGGLTGFKGKHYYTLLYDFMEGLNFDVIFISDNKDRENELLYHYTFSNDTLRLFEILGEVPAFEIGNLKYELYKK